MKFHLDFQPKQPKFRISHKDAIFLNGSCFSENISKKLSESGFNVLSNPFGISFNLLSLFSEISASIHGTAPIANQIIQNGETWHSFEAHSSIKASSGDELVHLLKQKRKATAEYLKTCSYVFITAGTVFYYRLQKNKALVANCQKQDSKLFDKQLSEIDELFEAAKKCIADLKSINPNIKIIFTISPVRHLRDGVEENFLSKSILRLAIHKICTALNDCFYFPAFELVNEDLKDYRFYEADLAHPNQQAIDYVWRKFRTTYFSEHTDQLAGLFEEKAKALRHHSLHTDAKETEHFQKHLAQLAQKIKIASGK